MLRHTASLCMSGIMHWRPLHISRGAGRISMVSHSPHACRQPHSSSSSSSASSSHLMKGSMSRMNTLRPLGFAPFLYHLHPP